MDRLLLPLALLSLFLFLTKTVHSQDRKTRTIITTDGEIDDVDSFVRMLLYANEFRIEGLIYSSSMWHYKGDGKGTTFTSEMKPTQKLYGKRTDLRWPGVSWMQELIDEYEKVYPNLITHADGYPTANYLRSLIRVGNIDFEGAMDKDTPGSDFIKEKLLDENAAPIFLQVWGGANTIARALKSIEDEYAQTPSWESIYQRVCDKAILYAISDQDAALGNYISIRWKDIKVFFNSGQFWCFGYPWPKFVPKEWHPYLQGEFMGQNIILNHGPLMKKYYSYGDGQKQTGDPEHLHGDLSVFSRPEWGIFKKYDFISEGDSPSYLHLINVGLASLNQPEWGGWGGRLVPSSTIPNRWEDGEAASDYNPFSKKMDKAFAQTRWLPAIQRDFASRADWCVKTFEEANHAPIVSLKHKQTLSAKPGQKITLKGKAKDPDKDELTYKWWRYKEAGSYPGDIEIQDDKALKAFFFMPEDIQKGQSIHFILEVSDKGTIPITRYQRVVVVY